MQFLKIAEAPHEQPAWSLRQQQGGLLRIKKVKLTLCLRSCCLSTGSIWQLPAVNDHRRFSRSSVSVALSFLDLRKGYHSLRPLSTLLRSTFLNYEEMDFTHKHLKRDPPPSHPLPVTFTTHTLRSDSIICYHYVIILLVSSFHSFSNSTWCTVQCEMLDWWCQRRRLRSVSGGKLF